MRWHYLMRINAPVPIALRGIFLPGILGRFSAGKSAPRKTAAQKETRHEAGFQRTGIELLQAGA